MVAGVVQDQAILQKKELRRFVVDPERGGDGLADISVSDEVEEVGLHPCIGRPTLFCQSQRHGAGGAARAVFENHNRPLAGGCHGLFEIMY